jgi:hypothetical protein
MPTVPTALPALNVTDAPLPVTEPTVELVSVHEYEIPPGQLLLHIGVAVNACEPPVDNVGVVGLSDTELNVTTTVMTVELSSVLPLIVALTKMPTVPTELAELNVTVAPLPLSEPRLPLVRDHA